VIAARRDYDVAANWKTLAENYHECCHCPSIHPELCVAGALFDWVAAHPGRCG
jgi:phenylpropionate dioxygenase-like ring-hydroxylating dioxygenase large terminal subunit